MQIFNDLKKIKGNGTSMISLIIPQNNNLHLTINKLNEEYGTASNIKSRTNRQSVQSALKSAIFQLKLIKQLPANGLALFSGENCYV